MKGFNTKFAALFAASMLFYGCEKEDDALDNMQVKESVMNGNCDVIMFEDLEAGDYVSSVSTRIGNVTVEGYAFDDRDTPSESDDGYDTDNRAKIFNSESWTGDDDDLATDDWGNILVVQQLGDEGAPNDNDSGAKLILTFPVPVTLNSMRVIDIDNGGDHPDENASYVRLYREDGTSVTIALPQEGDGEGYTLNLLGTQNVVSMEVVFDGVGAVGSGGIDHIEFCVPEEVEEGCTRTQGYWKTHSGYKPKGNGKGNSKYDATWDEYLNSTLARLGAATYPEILWMEPRGGNADIILAHQYIAAVLNVASGASTTDEVDDAMAGAADYFANRRTATRAQLLQWAETLDRYNNGIIGPGHCDD